jgi:hypothetical protein
MIFRFSRTSSRSVLGSAASVVILIASLAQSSKAQENQIEVGNYNKPRLNGTQVAFCLTAAGKCGKEAADAFCRSRDFEGALTFQRERMEGSAQLRFLRIKCWRALASVSERVETDVLSNTSAKSNRLRFGGRGEWR